MLITLILSILSIIAFSQFDNQSLSSKRDLCNLVKYIAALLVVNGHIFLFSFDHTLWTKEMNLGAQCVALFFFFSGYGLMFSYQSKGDAYLKGFVHKRLGRILLPLITAYALYIPIYWFRVGPIDPITILRSLYSPDPFLKFSWYVSEIIILYLLFYACFRFPFSLRKKALLLSTATITMMVMFYVLLGLDIFFICSTPCFILVLWYQLYENKIACVAKPKQLILSAFVLAATLFFFRLDWACQLVPVLTMSRFVFSSLFLVNIAVVMAVIIILRNLKYQYISQLLSCKSNLSIINSSYELYLCQICGFKLVGMLNPSPTLYYVCVMLACILIGYIMYLVNLLISKMMF